LLSPECLHLVEPRLQRDKTIGAQPVHAQASIMVAMILFTFDGDQTSFLYAFLCALAGR